ncbi:MAG TPA: thrombospondin type 3 repeat-containing protein [Opitutaceae bacterium]
MGKITEVATECRVVDTVNRSRNSSRSTPTMSKPVTWACARELPSPRAPIRAHRWVSWRGALGFGGLSSAVFSLVASVAAAPAIPEPPVVLYGSVSRTGSAAPLSPANVGWRITGNNESVVIPTATIVTVNGESFYITRIPFETRQLANGESLAQTANTLALTADGTTYTRTATVDGAPALLPIAQVVFAYGATSQGLIERIDLWVDAGAETFADWSQRIFGRMVRPSADEDGDGRSNHDEYLAGTDPRNPGSDLTVVDFTPAASGGYTITWTTVAGRTYRVERSTDLAPDSWETIQASVPGTGSVVSFTDTAPEASQHVFYRIVVNTPEIP